MKQIQGMSSISYAIGALVLIACLMTIGCAGPSTEESTEDPAGGGMEEATEQERVSPHESVSAMINGKNVTIEYGRPYKKEREIFGGLVPLGEVWRTGADEATTLATDGDLMVGTLHVPAGEYSLFTIPGESAWTLIVNKTAEQWGAFSYDASQDLGRAEMTVSALSAPVEQFTIAIEPTNGSEGVLKMTWDQTEASIGLMMH